MDEQRRVGNRLPIVVSGRGVFEFREHAVAMNLVGRPHGVIGWDPTLGWVLVLDPPRERDI